MSLKLPSPDFEKSTPQVSPDFEKSTPQVSPDFESDKHLKQMIYNSYYDADVELYGKKNCGKYRPSIESYPIKVQQYLSHLCDVIPLENIEFVVGPISYSEYEYNGMTISIFGEKHTINRAGCIYNHPKNTAIMYSFLDSVINANLDVFYDVFLEIDRAMVIPEAGMMNVKIPPKHVNYWKMTDTSSSFMQCIKTPEDCEYENARIHYTDIRNDFGAHEKNIFEAVPADIIPFFIKSMYTSNKRIMKEIGKSFLGTVILKYLELVIESYASDSTITTDDRDTVITATIMDMYLLSRVFKVFSVSQYPQKYPQKISNAIIYVGETHATHYRDFLEIVLGLTPNIKYIDKNIDYPDSCLDVKLFKNESKLFKSLRV